jgi:uncharacterized protein YndB with AHSA1/START domain
MASIRTETLIDAPVEDVWDALRDWGAPHERLVRGFVVDTRLDGEDRLVTFFTGTTVREVLVDCDDEARRLAWTIVDGPYRHHNGVARVIAEGDRTRFSWESDLLPDELAETTRAMMERGTAAVKETLESR